MDNRDDIEKIDKQINILKNKKNVISNNKDSSDNHEIFIDKKYSLGDKVPDEVVEDELDKTKIVEDLDKIDAVEDNVSNEYEDIKVENNDTKTKKINKIEEENPQYDNEFKKKKKIILIIILFAVIVIFISIVFVMTKKENSANYIIEEETDENNKLTPSEQEKIMNDYGTKLEEAIRVYYARNNKLLSYEEASKIINFEYNIYCYENEIYDDGQVYLNSCSINEENTTYGYGKKKVIPKEDNNDGYHIYVNKESFIAQLDKPSNTSNYNDYSLKIDDVLGDINLLNEYNPDYVFYLDSNKNGHIINFKTGKRALSSIDYQSILPIKNGNGFDYDYVGILVNNKWGIYKLSNNERVVSHIYDNMLVKYVGTDTSDNYIDSLSNGLIAVSSNDLIGVISYYNGKEIIPTNYKSLVKIGSYLLGIDSNDKEHIFDYSGEEYLKDKYNKIYGIISDKYVLVKKKNNTLLVSLNDELFYDYLDIKTNDYNYGIENNNGVLFQFFKEDGKCVNLYYNPFYRTGELKDSECN